MNCYETERERRTGVLREVARVGERWKGSIESTTAMAPSSPADGGVGRGRISPERAADSELKFGLEEVVD